FGLGTIGLSRTPGGATTVPPSDAEVQSTTTTSGGKPIYIADSKPAIVYDGSIGYKYRTQTFIAEYAHYRHDAYGHGGRNAITGFEGTVSSVAGSWYWAPPRGKWTAQSNFSLFRGPGNFSYIYTWLGIATVGRLLNPSLRLDGEFLYDR